MLDSVDGLTTKLSDYASEEGAPLLQPAQHANRVWKEVEKGASRALEHQYTQKVLTPVVNYIGELEGLKKLYEARHKKQMDFDYYRRKVQEMQVTTRRATRRNSLRFRAQFALTPAPAAHHRRRSRRATRRSCLATRRS